MKPIRVMIADDSTVFRSQVRMAFEGVSGLEVVAVARNGKQVIENVDALPIDLIILDLEMPELDGLGTLKLLRSRPSMPKVIVFSGVNRRSADITLDALRLGASDFVAKTFDLPGIPNSTLPPHERIRDLLLPRIWPLFGLIPPGGANASLREQPTPLPVAPPITLSPRRDADGFRPEIVVIGSSTGGPTALETIFSHVRGPLDYPILIAQHMPPVFTAALAERLGKLNGIASAEGRHDEPVEANRIYVAPGDYHMRLRRGPEGLRLSLDQTEKINHLRPAVDPLFQSASEIFNHKCLAIVLTGMGEDGKRGALAVKAAGGRVVIQNPESCVVFGMPGAVYAVNAYHQISTLEEIGGFLDRGSLAA